MEISTKRKNIKILNQKKEKYNVALSALRRAALNFGENDYKDSILRSAETLTQGLTSIDKLINEEKSRISCLCYTLGGGAVIGISIIVFLAVQYSSASS